MRQRVVFTAALRATSAGTALIEQNSVKAFRIEQPAVIGLAAAARPAMQIDGGDAVYPADGFDVNLVAVADGEQLRCQWCERVGALAGGFTRVGVRRHRRRPS